MAEEAGGFDFILADLGVSSMQIDNPGGAFSYKTDGPLDLRLDSSRGMTAAERLKGAGRGGACGDACGKLRMNLMRKKLPEG